MCQISYFKAANSIKALFLSIALLLTNAGHCEVPACNSSVEYTKVSNTDDYIKVQVKNNGVKSITAELFTYEKYSKDEIGTSIKDSSLLGATVNPGQSKILGTSGTKLFALIPPCTLAIVLKINGDSCIVPIATIAEASGYCKKCNTCKTPTPTPTPIPPTCDAGGPYTGPSIPCSATPVAVQLSAAKSTGVGLSYTWTSDCPKATFNNSSVVSPILSLITAPTAGTGPSVSCKVKLKVSSSNGLSQSCDANLAAQTCVRDCAGVINGSAVVDRCGVCNGDGQSCVGCNSVNISGNQLALDSNANAIRNLVLKVNRELLVGSNNAKLSSKELKANNAYASKSNSKASNLYKDVWTGTYTSFPSTMVTCAASFCVQVRTAESKAAIQSGNISMVVLSRASLARLKRIERIAKANKVPNLRKVVAATKKAASFVNQAEVLKNNSLNQLGQIPASQSTCN